MHLLRNKNPKLLKLFFELMEAVVSCFVREVWGHIWLIPTGYSFYSL